jgi:hypothetical protein
MLAAAAGAVAISGGALVGVPDALRQDGLTARTIARLLSGAVPRGAHDVRVNGVYGSAHSGTWQFVAHLTWRDADGVVHGGGTELPQNGGQPPIPSDLSADELTREHRIGWTVPRLRRALRDVEIGDTDLAMVELEITPEKKPSVVVCSADRTDTAAACVAGRPRPCRTAVHRPAPGRGGVGRGQRSARVSSDHDAVLTRTAMDGGRRWRWRRRAGLLAVLVLLLLVGFLRTLGGAPPAQQLLATPEPTFAETNAPFPSDTASDVVSYADHVALVTAVSQVEATPTASPSPGTQGEPAIPRRITFRIDRTLWSRADAPAAPTQLTALWRGWLVRDGKRVPFVIHGMPWVIVGAQYVMPIAQDHGTFAPIQPFAVFRVTDGVVDLEDQDTPLARDLADLSPTALTDVFAKALPDPLAVRFRNLSPRARLAAVLATRSSVSPTARSSGLLG